MTLLAWKPDEPMPPQSRKPVNLAGGADKYQNDPAISENYDAKRVDNPKWIIEQRLIQQMLMDAPSGSSVLDIPCGTGRFFQFYADRRLKVTAADKAERMLAKARPKAVGDIRFALADVRDLSSCPDRFDAAVMCRLTRWLEPEECTQAITELCRVTKDRIIFTARCKPHPIDRLDACLAGMGEGWHVHRNEAGIDETYRIVELRRAP